MEVQNSRIGWIRHVADGCGQSLVGCIQASIEPGATVPTDGWSGFAGQQKPGYRHRGPPTLPYANMVESLSPRVHFVLSLLRHWFQGTYPGNVGARPLPDNWDEFTFRSKRRRSLQRGQNIRPNRRASDYARIPSLSTTYDHVSTVKLEIGAYPDTCKLGSSEPDRSGAPRIVSGSSPRQPYTHQVGTTCNFAWGLPLLRWASAPTAFRTAGSHRLRRNNSSSLC